MPLVNMTGIKTTRPLRAATRTVETTPAGLVQEFENLYTWARKRNLRVGEPDSGGRMNLPWTAVLHDESDTTDETPRRVDLWIPIDGAGPSVPGYTVRDIAFDNVAFTIHKGPMTQLGETIEQLFAWAAQKSLTFRGRLHRRIYLRGIDGPPEDPDWEAEIQIPLLTLRS